MYSRLSVIQSWEELESVRPFWEDAANHPNADFQFYSEALRAREEVLRPYVIVVREDSELRALLLCRLERSLCPIALGYSVVVRLPVRTLVVMHGGVLGQLCYADAASAVGLMADVLQSGSATRIWFNAVTENSPLATAALRLTNRWTRRFLLERAPHWYIPIPPQPGGFMAQMKSKHRSWLHRMERDLGSQFPGGVHYVTYRLPEELRHAMRDVEIVARKTYQRGLGAGPQANDEHARRYHIAAVAKRLRVWVLYAGGKPIAFRIGQVYGETIHGEGIGYDPDMARFRPGNLLLAHAIDQLSREGVKRYDLGLGDASYKRQFGKLQNYDLSFSVFGSNPLALATGTTIGATHGFNQFIKRVMERLKLIEVIKNRWRSRLAEPRSDER